MKVVSLVGKSGSGKSYKAIIVAKDLDIEYIIDDGLLIKGNKVIGGKSAKAENTTISAVKRAVFTDYIHRKYVSDIIKNVNPKNILILGTSDKMVDKIAKALNLPNIEKRLYIEDISSQDEIKLAVKERKTQGKHVIPVPTFEVKKDFSGYFIDTLKIFKKRDSIKGKVYEKTVVRPNFSYLGKYTISDGVIRDITKFTLSKVKEIEKVLGIYIKNHKEGLFIDIEICIIYGYNIKDTGRYIQEILSKEIENMTSLHILGINVLVKKIIIKDEIKNS